VSLRPLKVLYLIDSLGPGGAQRQLVTLLSHLDPSVVSPELVYYHSLEHFREALETTGVTAHVLRGRGGKDPRTIFRLIRLLNRSNFDIIHSYLPTPGVLARAAGLIGPRVGIVISFRGPNFAGTPWRLALERLLAQRADAAIANSRCVRDEVRRLIPALSGKVRVIRNGISVPSDCRSLKERAQSFRSRYLQNGGCMLLGVVGRMERDKNPLLLVRALHLLDPQALSRLQVIWVGPENDRELAAEFRRSCREAGVESRVHVIPVTTDMECIYLAIDALLLTSSRESLPNVVLEALAHARPVVATDVGDVRALLSSGGVRIVPPDDSGALAASIDELLDTSEAERETIGARAADYVLHEYAVDRMVEATIDVYREVAQMAPAREVSGTE